MAEQKTRPTNQSVKDFISTMENPAQLADTVLLVDLFRRWLNVEPTMWGTIIGFGTYHYTYKSGHSGSAPVIGLAPRKNAISLYLAQDMPEREILLQQLGKHKAGKGCVNIKTVADINTDVLAQMVSATVQTLSKNHHVVL